MSNNKLASPSAVSGNSWIRHWSLHLVGLSLETRIHILHPLLKPPSSRLLSKCFGEAAVKTWQAVYITKRDGREHVRRIVRTFSLAGRRGWGAGRTPHSAQFLSFSCSFRQKSCEMIGFGSNSGDGAPSGTFWIPHCSSHSSGSWGRAARDMTSVGPSFYNLLISTWQTGGRHAPL